MGADLLRLPRLPQGAEARARGKARAGRARGYSRSAGLDANYTALVLAGEPVNNRRLAELMGCSPGEASRRVAQLEGAISKARKGREVLISLA